MAPLALLTAVFEAARRVVDDGEVTDELRELFGFEGSWYSTTAWEITSGPLADGWTADFLAGLFGWSAHPERIRVVAYFAFLVPTLWFYFRDRPATPVQASDTEASRAAEPV